MMAMVIDRFGGSNEIHAIDRQMPTPALGKGALDAQPYEIGRALA